MARGYGERCRERLERLRRRAEFLGERIAMRVDSESVHDKMERSALLWAIEEIERWDRVADVLRGDMPDAEKLLTISAFLRMRLRPSEAEIERHPSLARHGQ